MNLQVFCTVSTQFMWYHYTTIALSCPLCVDYSFFCIIKQLFGSLEQNIGCWRQAVIQPQLDFDGKVKQSQLT